jgi:RNA polymerase-interacting CarD/CdnL/TRCF family regulator
MENDTGDILLNARLIDLHRRKTEAELKGYGTKPYETLIELCQLEIAEIEDARRSRYQDAPDAT